MQITRELEHRHISVAALLVLLTLTPRVLRAQAREWARCYDLEIGPWSEAVGEDSLFYSPPPRIRLDTLPADRPSNGTRWYRIAPAPGSPPSIHRYAAWRPTGEDSLVLGGPRASAGFRRS